MTTSCPQCKKERDPADFLGINNRAVKLCTTCRSYNNRAAAKYLVRRKAGIHKPHVGPSVKCSVDGCDTVHKTLGFCKKHYGKYWRYGNPTYVDPVFLSRGFKPGRVRCPGCESWREPGWFDGVHKNCTKCVADGVKHGAAFRARKKAARLGAKLDVKEEFTRTIGPLLSLLTELRRKVPLTPEERHRRQAISNRETKKRRRKARKGTMWDLIRRFRSVNTTKLATLDVYYLLHKFRLRCAYCDVRQGEERHHIEHVHPKSKGGTNDVCNLVLACKYCNCDKGVLPWRSWFQDQGFYCPDRARIIEEHLTSGLVHCTDKTFMDEVLDSDDFPLPRLKHPTPSLPPVGSNINTEEYANGLPSGTT